MKIKLMARELCWKHLGLNTSLTVGGHEYNGVIIGISQRLHDTKPVRIHIDTGHGQTTLKTTCGHEITLWEEQ